MEQNLSNWTPIFYEDGHVRLQPENRTMDPIYADTVTVLGKLVALIRQF